jgi:hypothetical protein
LKQPPLPKFHAFATMLAFPFHEVLMNQTHLRLLMPMIAAVVQRATAQSAIISMDLNQPGDGLLTYDTITHREWLDLSQTDVLQLATVEQSLKPGGSLFGFHIATAADVSALATSAGYVGLDASSPDDFTAASNLINLLGQDLTYETDVTTNDYTNPYDKTLPTGGTYYVIGIYTNGLVRDAANSDTLIPFTIETVTSGSTSFIATRLSQIGTGLDFGGTLTQATVGASWLYRDVTVPEPSSAILFLLAGCANAIFRRRATKLSWPNRFAA